jgi:small subunit ribosomal protein S12
MPTINQLVKHPRRDKTVKSKSPALQYTKNSIKRITIPLACPQKR